MVLGYSNAYFSGTNVFRGNKAFNGGGIALYQDSTMKLLHNTTLKIEDNIAENSFMLNFFKVLFTKTVIFHLIT